MLKLKIRRSSLYTQVTLEVDNTLIDFGLLDHNEIVSLRDKVKEILDDLDWVVNVTSD